MTLQKTHNQLTKIHKEKEIEERVSIHKQQLDMDKLSKSREKSKNKIRDLNFLLYCGSENSLFHLKAYLDKLVVIWKSNGLKIKR